MCLPPPPHTSNEVDQREGLTGALYQQMFIQLIWGQTAWTLRQEHSFTYPGSAFDGDISPVSAFICPWAHFGPSTLWSTSWWRCTVAGCIRDDLELRSYLHQCVFWRVYTGAKVNVVLICTALIFFVFTDKYALGPQITLCSQTIDMETVTLNGSLRSLIQ